MSRLSLCSQYTNISNIRGKKRIESLLLTLECDLSTVTVKNFRNYELSTLKSCDNFSSELLELFNCGSKKIDEFDGDDILGFQILMDTSLITDDVHGMNDQMSILGFSCKKMSSSG